MTIDFKVLAGKRNTLFLGEVAAELQLGGDV